MSPETFDESILADARTDLWSFGVTLFCCLSDGEQLPFGTAASTKPQMMRAILSEDVLPPRLPELDSEVHSILDQSLRKNPHERFQARARLLSPDVGRSPCTGALVPHTRCDAMRSGAMRCSTDCCLVLVQSATDMRLAVDECLQFLPRFWPCKKFVSFVHEVRELLGKIKIEEISTMQAEDHVFQKTLQTMHQEVTGGDAQCSVATWSAVISTQDPPLQLWKVGSAPPEPASTVVYSVDPTTAIDPMDADGTEAFPFKSIKHLAAYYAEQDGVGGIPLVQFRTGGPDALYKAMSTRSEAQLTKEMKKLRERKAKAARRATLFACPALPCVLRGCVWFHVLTLPRAPFECHSVHSLAPLRARSRARELAGGDPCAVAVRRPRSRRQRRRESGLTTHQMRSSRSGTRKGPRRSAWCC